MAMNRAYLVVFIFCLVLYPSSLVEAQEEVAPSPISYMYMYTVALEENPVDPVIHRDVDVEDRVVNRNEEKMITKRIEKNMVMTTAKTEDILKVLKKKMKDPKKPVAEDCLSTCIEVYEDAIDAMKTSIEDMKARDYYKANIDISAVGTDMDTCDDCYADMLTEDAEIKKFDKWVLGITGESLSDLQAISPS